MNYVTTKRILKNIDIFSQGQKHVVGIGFNVQKLFFFWQS